MKLIRKLLLVISAIAVSACATRQQPPLDFSKDSLTSPQNQTVGIYVTYPNKADTYLDGANCLLCMATASIANQSLTAHTQTLSLSDLNSLKQDLLKRLQLNNTQVTLIDKKIDLSSLEKFSTDKPNYAHLDYRPLKNNLKVNKLLVIEVTRIGFQRNYADYVPTSAPKAHLAGVGYIVDLSTNAYNWYQSNKESKSAGKQWDEPPSFPGLTNAYYEVIEQYKDHVLNAFNK